MLEIFEYTERVVAMVRPRKLLFMAIGSSHLHLESTFLRHHLVVFREPLSSTDLLSFVSHLQMESHLELR